MTTTGLKYFSYSWEEPFLFVSKPYSHFYCYDFNSYFSLLKGYSFACQSESFIHYIRNPYNSRVISFYFSWNYMQIILVSLIFAWELMIITVNLLLCLHGLQKENVLFCCSKTWKVFVVHFMDLFSSLKNAFD